MDETTITFLLGVFLGVVIGVAAVGLFSANGR